MAPNFPTMAQAAMILACELKPCFKYESYANETDATRIADAMSVATGSCWLVKQDPNVGDSFWVYRSGK